MVGHRLGLLWCWMICLGNEPRSFSHFKVATKSFISDTFVDCEAYPTFSKVFLPTVVNVHSCHLLFGHLLFDHVPFQFTLIHGPTIPDSYAVLFFTASDSTFTTRHIHTWVFFPLWPSCFILPGAISNFPLLLLYWTPSHLGAHLPASYLFAFSYCPWGSSGRNTGMSCNFLLPWILFFQNSSLWPFHLGWPCMAWLIASLS